MSTLSTEVPVIEAASCPQVPLLWGGPCSGEGVATENTKGQPFVFATQCATILAQAGSTVAERQLRLTPRLQGPVSFTPFLLAVLFCT